MTLPLVLRDRIILPSGTVVVDEDSILAWLRRGADVDGHLPDTPRTRRFVAEIARTGHTPPTFADVEAGAEVHRVRSRRLLEPSGDATTLRDELRARCPSVEHVERFDREWRWMEEVGMTTVLPVLRRWLEDAEREGVVVGLGRGSACASLVLHLLGLHAVDPVRWRIPFSEFSHEGEDG